MRILVTGKTGQVGCALISALTGYDVIGIGREDCNLNDLVKLEKTLKAIQPKLIIHSAAYTQVDQAEKEANLVSLINYDASNVIAYYCQNQNIPLIYYSTDYVFSGNKVSPYLETDAVNPIGIYGQSKEKGEVSVRRYCEQHVILRTSWVYDEQGKNFLNTILKLAQTKEHLNVIDDQFGAPTSSHFIAEVTKKILDQIQLGIFPWGTYHLTNSGSVNWYNFARTIIENAKALGMTLSLSSNNITPVPSDQYLSLVKRPLNSRLNCAKLENILEISMQEWEVALMEIMQKISKRNGVVYD